MNFIESILPNATSIPDEFLEATIETLYMTLWTAGLGFVLGLGLGVWLVLTQPKGLKANAAVYGVLDKFVNIFRSIPFVIMIALLVNITRLIGTSIGTTAAIVPLVVATVPFYARQIQNALVEVNQA